MTDRCSQTLVIILSTHRSGSSVTARIFQRLGMSLGPYELVGEEASNPYGHFESFPIIRLNSDVQELIHGFRDEIPKSEGVLEEFLKDRPKWDAHCNALDEFVARGRVILEGILDSGTVAGFKDPRTALVWPFWQRVLADFPGLRVVPIVLLRSPHEIAMSMCARREGRLGYWDCLDVVSIHLRRLREIADSSPLPKLRIRFGGPSFLDDVRAAACHCGLQWDAAMAQEMIDESCIHHVPAGVPHESQTLCDSLWGDPPTFDAEGNQARLIADARLLDRLSLRQLRRHEEQVQKDHQSLSEMWRRLDQIDSLLQPGKEHDATAQCETSRSPDDLVERVRQHLDRTHEELSRTLADTIRTLKELNQTSTELNSTRDDLNRTQAALAHAQAEARGLAQLCEQQAVLCEQRALLCEHQKKRLEKFEHHPILGPTLRARRQLRRSWVRLKERRESGSMPVRANGLSRPDLSGDAP